MRCSKVPVAMRLSAIILAVLPSACGPDKAVTPLDGLDLTPCAGWTGSTPSNQRLFALAASAEKRGRECANSKLAAASEARGKPR